MSTVKVVISQKWFFKVEMQMLSLQTSQGSDVGLIVLIRSQRLLCEDICA